jgi:hypothetical protein
VRAHTQNTHTRTHAHTHVRTQARQNSELARVFKQQYVGKFAFFTLNYDNLLEQALDLRSLDYQSVKYEDLCRQDFIEESDISAYLGASDGRGPSYRHFVSHLHGIYHQKDNYIFSTEVSDDLFIVARTRTSAYAIYWLCTTTVLLYDSEYGQQRLFFLLLIQDYKASMLRFLRFLWPHAKAEGKSLVFIGCSGTFEDQHFKKLFKQMAKSSSSADVFVLVRGGEAAAVKERMEDQGLADRFHIVPYSFDEGDAAAQYQCLAPFLGSFFPPEKEAEREADH